MGRRIASVVLAVSFGAFGGCGGQHSLTGPDPVAAPIPSAQAAFPAHVYGAFAASADVPEMAAQGGNVVLVLPTYADDARAVAAALRGKGQVAILSAHHVFGGPQTGWEQGWARTKEWAAPFADLIAAVYVIDEPMFAGIPPAHRDAAVAFVRAAGYRTMLCEQIDEALRYGRPSVDLFAVYAYDWPGPGSWTVERAAASFAVHPEWDIAVGQGFDWHIHGGRQAESSGSITATMSRWAEIGRQRRGLVFWVARWPGQTGILDEPEALAAYRQAASR